MTTTTTALRAVLQAAIEEAGRLRAIYDAPEADPDGPEWDAWSAADDAVEAAREALRSALRASDEPREYTLRDGDSGVTKVVVCAPGDVESACREWVEGGCYGELEETVWVDVYVTGEDGTDERYTVDVDPEEPDCAGAETHAWRSPVEIVGGIKENPGVWGKGGGVVIREVCVRCGCGRVTDTWAQRPDTGEQGLQSVRYEIGAYADEIEALRDSAE